MAMTSMEFDTSTNNSAGGDIYTYPAAAAPVIGYLSPASRARQPETRVARALINFRTRIDRWRIDRNILLSTSCANWD